MNYRTGNRGNHTSGESETSLTLPGNGRGTRQGIDPLLAHVAKLAAEWKVDLEHCVEGAGVETVHHVRTGTRRVEAMIDVLMGEAALHNTALEEAAARWRQQLKKIRRAAAPVRDLDVHRSLLEHLTELGKKGDLEHPGTAEEQATPSESTTAVQSQAEKLDTWLKQARETHAAMLSRQIKKRLARLDGLASDFAVAWQGQQGRKRPVRKPAMAALDEFAALSQEMPLLDEDNLHDFRKGVKKARYVTEAGENDVQAEAVGRAIKRVQDAIGDWHDWQCLAEEADTALRGDGPELGVILHSQVSRTFQAARRTTNRMRGRLVGEWRAMHQTRTSRNPSA